MTASTHLAVGAAVGLTVHHGCLSVDAGNPERLFWAFAAGFVSHLVLDAFPHQEYALEGTKLGVVLLVEIVVIFGILLSPSSSLLTNAIIFFGMVGGAVPDTMNLVYRNIVSWPWIESVGLKIHFCHGAIPIGFAVDFYLQALVALIAVILVRFRLAL